MADPVAEIRLASTNRRKAALRQGAVWAVGTCAAVFMFLPRRIDGLDRAEFRHEAPRRPCPPAGVRAPQSYGPQLAHPGDGPRAGAERARLRAVGGGRRVEGDSAGRGGAQARHRGSAVPSPSAVKAAHREAIAASVSGSRVT
jgi:hypothetical protein